MSGKYKIAERGSIYRWKNGDNENICLVVSSDDRRADNLISILFLSTIRNGYDDTVVIELDGKDMCVHTDLVTYTKRKYLKDKIDTLSDYTMKLIDKKLAYGLSLQKENI